MATTVNKWDSEEYKRRQAAVKLAAEAAEEWISSGLGRTEVERLAADYDERSILPQAIRSFKTATVRLNNLYKTMETYLTDYEDMVARAESKMDSVEEVESVYGSFGSILAGVTTATGAVLAGSAAYRFAYAGKTFSGDYNDMTAFMNSDVYGLASGFLGLSNINNWEMYCETIGSAITGSENDYVSDVLRSGLKSMVEGIPGSEPVSFKNLDWDVIGAKLGIANLAEIMKPLDEFMTVMSGQNLPTDDDISWLSKVISVIKETLKGVKGSDVLVDLLDGFGGALKSLGNVDKVLDYCSELFANYFNTYADQIGYLNTMKDALETAGYWTDSPVMKQIDELQSLYEDAVRKSADYAWNSMIKDKAINVAKEAVITKIPVLKSVDTFYDVASKTSALYGTDRVEAAQSLMGYYQYDNILIQTYEKYAALVESGAATEAEVAEADRLFEMVHTLKTKEYEAIKTISEGKDVGWYNRACNKLEELEQFGKSSKGYTSSEGSSGGGRIG